MKQGRKCAQGDVNSQMVINFEINAFSPQSVWITLTHRAFRQDIGSDDRFKKARLSSHPIRSSVAFGDFTVDPGIDRDEIMVHRMRRSGQLGY